MNLIVAVDKNWAIGNKNELLIRIPKDQRFFKDLTFGKTVVMGRKTFESFPNGLPLKGRLNIILTNDINYQVCNAVVLNCLDDLYDELKKYETKDIYVIGGESIYKQLLDKCDTAYVTLKQILFSQILIIIQSGKLYMKVKRKLIPILNIIFAHIREWRRYIYDYCLTRGFRIREVHNRKRTGNTLWL